MNPILMYAASRLRDELVKTAAVSFVAATATAAGQYAVHWAINKWQEDNEDESEDPESEEDAGEDGETNEESVDAKEQEEQENQEDEDETVDVIEQTVWHSYTLARLNTRR